MIINLLGYLGVLTMIYSFSALSNNKKSVDTVELNVKFNKFSQSFEPMNKQSILVTSQIKQKIQKIVSK